MSSPLSSPLGWRRIVVRVLAALGLLTLDESPLTLDDQDITLE